VCGFLLITYSLFPENTLVRIFLESNSEKGRG